MSRRNSGDRDFVMRAACEEMWRGGLTLPRSRRKAPLTGSEALDRRLARASGSVRRKRRIQPAIVESAEGAGNTAPAVTKVPGGCTAIHDRSTEIPDCKRLCCASAWVRKRTYLVTSLFQ